MNTILTQMLSNYTLETLDDKKNAVKEITIQNIKEMLNKRFDEIDFEQAKEDVKPFIKDNKSLDVWCADFFKAITNDLK